MAIGLGTVGVAARQSDAARHVTWECDHVALTDVDELETARVDFRDGSYVESANGVEGPEPVRLGSPGRTGERVTITFDDDTTATLANPAPECSRRHRATTFTATQVHLPPAEFLLSSSIPSVLTTRVQLHFVDGTSQVAQDYSADGRGDVDDFPEIPGLFARFGLDAVPNSYRGIGVHEGKTIAAIEISTDEGYRTHFLQSDVAKACQYGATSAQERIIEVVGTSPGAVSYEFTANGRIHAVRINDRIKTEDNDRITANDDGTWTVSGFTGAEGFGDSYVVNGAITDFRQTGGDGEYVVRSLERRLLDR